MRMLLATTDRRSYAPGQRTRLELQNDPVRAWGHNLCTSEFEPALPQLPDRITITR